MITSYPPCQHKDILASIVFPFWCVLGAYLFGQRDTMGKSRNSHGGLLPHIYSGQFGKERNNSSFENEEHFVQRLKHFFLCNLWA